MRQIKSNSVRSRRRIGLVQFVVCSAPAPRRAALRWREPEPFVRGIYSAIGDTAAALIGTRAPRSPDKTLFHTSAYLLDRGAASTSRYKM